MSKGMKLMRFRGLLLAVLFVQSIVICQPILAMSCSDLFRSAVVETSRWRSLFDMIGRPFGLNLRKPDYIGPKLELSEATIQELRSAQQFIQDYHRAKNSEHESPDHITLNSRQFDVDLRLGGGTEGEVFLVRSGEEVFAVKRFYHLDQMKRNIRYIRNARRQGIPMIEPLQVDMKNKLALFPYIDGIDVGLIFRPWSIDNNVTVPLSKATRDYIEGKYDEFVDELQPRTEHPIIDNNVVLDLLELRFVFIDPR